MMDSAAIKRIKSMVSSIMGDIRENTTVSKNDCDQVEGRLIKFFEKNPTDIWLISNIQDYAKEVTGRTISTDLAGTVSELMYSYSNMSAYGIGFTPEFVEKQILSAFDKRFTNIVIYPATSDVPPVYPVETNIADQFVAIGVLADAEPPKNEGDEELIAELGSNEISVVEYAAGLGTKIDRPVNIIDFDPSWAQDSGPSMS
jgi:hypothetical protein